MYVLEWVKLQAFSCLYFLFVSLVTADSTVTFKLKRKEKFGAYSRLSITATYLQILVLYSKWDDK